MEEELPVTPEEHRDLIQSPAVLWWLEWELDFWLGQLSPAPYEPLRPTWPLRSSIHLTEVQAAEPLDVTVSLPYQDFQDDHKVKAAPWGPKVTVQKMRFIGCFQQLHWLWGRKGRLYPSGNVSMERRLQTQRQQW